MYLAIRLLLPALLRPLPRLLLLQQLPLHQHSLLHLRTATPLIALPLSIMQTSGHMNHETPITHWQTKLDVVATTAPTISHKYYTMGAIHFAQVVGIMRVLLNGGTEIVCLELIIRTHGA